MSYLNRKSVHAGCVGCALGGWPRGDVYTFVGERGRRRRRRKEGRTREHMVKP